MALIEQKVPSPGESITEVVIARWLKKNGDSVQKDEAIGEIDSDKATLTLNAEDAGEIQFLAQEGDTVKVGQVVCKIDTSKAGTPTAPVSINSASSSAPTKPAAPASTANPATTATPIASTVPSSNASPNGLPSPAARKMMEENNIPAQQISATGKDGRITKGDVLGFLKNGPAQRSNNSPIQRQAERKKMTPLRKKLSQRLVAVKNTTAMLTTFNEVDMSQIYALRSKYKDKFKEVHGVGLGFMSFFTQAVCIALQEFPAVNAMIDGDEIVYYNYCDVGIAVSAPKGLVVPVLRNAESMTLAQIEAEIKNLAIKARDNKIELKDMEGGTFTITNGGVFGSLMSTPIINPPQSAILGMHNVVDRPVAVNGQVIIRPMMYIALSYDHRIIDGRESVGFLVRVKELCENPIKLLTAGKEPNELVLGL